MDNFTKQKAKDYCFAFKYSDIGEKGDIHELVRNLGVRTDIGISYEGYSHSDFYSSVPKEADKECDIFVYNCEYGTYNYYTPATNCIAYISLSMKHIEKLRKYINETTDYHIGVCNTSDDLKKFYAEKSLEIIHCGNCGENEGCKQCPKENCKTVSHSDCRNYISDKDFSFGICKKNPQFYIKGSERVCRCYTYKPKEKVNFAKSSIIKAQICLADTKESFRECDFSKLDDNGNCVHFLTNYHSCTSYAAKKENWFEYLERTQK